MATGEAILVRKLRADGSEAFRWPGRVLEQDEQGMVVVARFNGPPRVEVGPFVLEHGDLFVEFYYFDRWYNVFQVYSPAGELKGWYCNVCAPAKVSDGMLLHHDLVLDVVAGRTGEHVVRDQDEYEAIVGTYAPHLVEGTQAGLRDLIELAERRAFPSRAFADAAKALDQP